MATAKVVLNGRTIVDMTDATATCREILAGYTAYGADGSLVLGNAETGAGDVTQDENGYLVLSETGRYRLPNGYTALPYVRSTGGSWINTGIYHPICTSSFYWRGRGYNESSGQKGLFGYQGNPVASYRIVCLIEASTNNLIAYAAQSGASTLAGWNASGMNEIYLTETEDATYPVAYVNGTRTQMNKTMTTQSAKTQSAIFFMAQNYQGSPTTNDKAVDGSYIDCCEFKMFAGGGLIRYYQPAQRDSDDAVGFYEHITGTFCPSIGDNPFIAGT